MNEVLITALSIEIAIALFILILLKPYIGIISILASLPVVDLLPKIPLLTSIIVPIGAVTIIGFLLQRKEVQGKPLLRLGNVQIIGLLFVFWIFISNPEAAWFGASRNWIFTFFQCWVLLWLTGELLDSPKKQQLFMWVFSIVAAISALIAIQQGYIGETVGLSSRGGGLTDQPNISARYFVVAMIFFSYLNTVVNRSLPRLLAIGGIVITFVGVFFTVSRSGILLLFVAIGLQILFNKQRKNKYRTISIIIISAMTVWFLSDNLENILKSIIPSIEKGSDTVGIRLILWRAGFHMWLDNIFLGVGIGMYPAQLRYYAPELLPRYWSLQAHNTYINVLAETGLIGIILFLSLIFFAFKNFLMRITKLDSKQEQLRNAWITVFIIVLLGGITMGGQYDKLLWFLMGISVYDHNKQYLKKQKEVAISPIINTIVANPKAYDG